MSHDYFKQMWLRVQRRHKIVLLSINSKVINFEISLPRIISQYSMIEY